MINNKLDPQLQARNLYWQGWKITEIAKHLNIKPATIYSWKTRNNWDGSTPCQRIAVSAEARLIQLIHLPKKTDGDYKEIKQLNSLVNDYSKNHNRKSHEIKPQQERVDYGASNKTKNYFSDEQIKRLNEIFTEQLFDYQRIWLDAGKQYRLRNILKSRQIGATYFFAREALVDALKTGRNQIFLSASRSQAFQFKQYIQDLASQVDVELKGDVIKIGNNHAELHFLGTNSRTAQGRHGNVYIDEYFWINDFTKLSNLAEPMAAQKQYRTTYFSTPSYQSHDAYPFWTGDAYNTGRAKSDHIHLDISHQALRAGRLDSDGQWRQIMTLDDAQQLGCNLFDKDYLLKRYSPDMYRMLFECEFGQGGDSVFSYAELQKCAVDSWEVWADFYKPYTLKPVGNTPVWVGYDPTDSGDAAGLIVAVPPNNDEQPFRIIESRLLFGNDFQQQAAVIKELFSVYNVQKIVIDKTGIGSAVFQLVEKFYPLVIGLRYDMELKAMMIYKTMNLFKHQRVEWDAQNKDLLISFLGIRREMTKSGKNMTYVADRSAAAGHCDLAWAAMGLFYQEPLDGSQIQKASLEID